MRYRASQRRLAAIKREQKLFGGDKVQSQLLEWDEEQLLTRLKERRSFLIDAEYWRMASRARPFRPGEPLNPGAFGR